MSVNIIDVLQYLVPGCSCCVWENDIDRIVWNDARPQPSKTEIETAIPAINKAKEKVEANISILDKIEALEAKQTLRRMRDAIDGTDGGWLKNLESEIVALRVQLT